MGHPALLPFQRQLCYGYLYLSKSINLTWVWILEPIVSMLPLDHWRRLWQTGVNGILYLILVNFFVISLFRCGRCLFPSSRTRATEWPFILNVLSIYHRQLWSFNTLLWLGWLGDTMASSEAISSVTIPTSPWTFSNIRVNFFQCAVFSFTA